MAMQMMCTKEDDKMLIEKVSVYAVRHAIGYLVQ